MALLDDFQRNHLENCIVKAIYSIKNIGSNTLLTMHSGLCLFHLLLILSIGQPLYLPATGSPNNNTTVEGLERDVGAGVFNQLWYLENGSTPGYFTMSIYINLPPLVRADIYNSTGLAERTWRSGIFDCKFNQFMRELLSWSFSNNDFPYILGDDFAFEAKSAVARWGNGYIRAKVCISYHLNPLPLLYHWL